MNTKHLSILLPAVWALAGLPGARADAQPSPHAWQRWEHVLTSARGYGNPYADVTLRV